MFKTEIEELKKMKKDELVQHVVSLYEEILELDTEVERLSKEVNLLKTRYQGAIGAGGKRNPLVR